MTVEAVPDLRIEPPDVAAPPRATALSLLRRFVSPQNRYLAPFLITCILLAAQLQYGVLESSPKPLLLAISVAILVEMTLGRLILGRFPHVASAYITGISVGIILRSPAFWPYALCSAVSIVSKYALRVRGRHLFNPSNFGVSAMFFLYATHAAPLSVQWGNAVWAVIVIWLLGCVIVGRLRRLHITLTYVLSFVAFAAVRAAILSQPFLTEVTPITSAPYQLFIFFMITDPGTTVRSKWGQVLTAFLVACVESMLRLRENVHAPYYALFIVFPVANLIEMAWAARSSRAAQTTAPVASA